MHSLIPSIYIPRFYEKAVHQSAQCWKMFSDMLPFAGYLVCDRKGQVPEQSESMWGFALFLDMPGNSVLVPEERRKCAEMSGGYMT